MSVHGSFDAFSLDLVAPPAPDQIAAATHHVCTHAHDRDDAALLLAALGIDPKEL